MHNQNNKLLQLLDLSINKITDDSRDVEKGDIFVAIRGDSFDGHSYISDAISKGAIAIVYDQGNPKATKKVKLLKVKDSREALATLVARYYEDAHLNLTLIGITGTNGKTTTAEFTYQILNKLGRKTGLISTISAKTPEVDFDTGFHVTTPGASMLHKFLKEMSDANCDFAVIETTSHGFVQKRTHGLQFEVGAITNITPEHLDYHKTLKNYIDAKSTIFEQSKRVVLNKNDPALAEELKRLPKHKKHKIVDYKDVGLPKEFVQNFPGQYNLENAAVAFSIVEHLLGKQSTKVFEDLENVKGRMEKIPNNKKLQIIIDFAHDNNSLEKVLKEVAKVVDGRLIHVFGCAGLRDKSKRPKMGKISTEYADITVITAEDPRTESLDEISKEIVSGIDKKMYSKDKDYFVIDDRQEAISFAINKLATAGDTVLITGKGHEKSMCYGTTEHPWSDQEAVSTALGA